MGEHQGIVANFVRRCKWLARSPVNVKKRICAAKRYQSYSAEANLAPASRLCFTTCAPFCLNEYDDAKFIFDKNVKDNGEIEIFTRQCQWLARKDSNRIAKICAKNVDYEGFVYGQASQICTKTCSSCDTKFSQI